MAGSADTRVAELAARQHGVVARRQAIALGCSESAVHRRLRRFQWEPLLPGVYRPAGAPGSFEQRVMAACLWAGEGALASFQTAARLWGLDGLPWRTEEEVHISVPRPRAPGCAGGVRIHRTADLTGKDEGRVKGVPVTNLPRTLIDLASALDSKHLEMALESALRKRTGRDLLPWIEKRLQHLGSHGRRGIGALRALLRLHRGKTETLDSALEVRVGQLLRELQLPGPDLHYDICDGIYHVANVDFAWPSLGIALQAIGEGSHRTRQRWSRDLDQLSTLASLGWLVILVTWSDLERRPEEIRRQLLRAFELRRSQARVAR